MKVPNLGADVLELVRLFEEHGVRYLLVGGHAVFIHGYPRLTADVDFAYSPDAGNAERLYRALVEFWGEPVPAVGSAAELADEGMIFQFGRPPNRVDLLSHVDGIEFEAAWARRTSVVVDTPEGRLTIDVIGLDDLRRAKAAAGRAKDLDDLEHLPDGRV